MLNFSIDISAPADKVSSTMLGEETYRLWAAEFYPGSYYEGGWNKGDKICFLAINTKGKKAGMVSEIADHVPNRLVAIRHRGIVDGDREITEGPEVQDWAGAIENYTFIENGGITTVAVNVDAPEKDVDYFNDAWTRALDKLKTITESR